ncbi:MAG: cobalamin-independent methionine synthase II family protein [Acidimicrobiia bacterium]|nr:cobalamin-independent methionine synthase II family protein [Acidimicrobiia bacterium]
MKTQRTAQLPPFYTQVIGSLPRPQVVRDRLSRSHEPQSLDALVAFAIQIQEEAKIDVISDGEWRRVHYIDEFLNRIGGFERVRRFEHAGEIKLQRVVVKRIEPRDPVFAADAAFLANQTSRCRKFALPSPFLIAIRYWHTDYSRDVYPTYQHLMEHLAEILRQEAEAVVAAGIDVVQLDDPALTYFCDRRLMAGDSSHDERLRREWKPDVQVAEAVAAINRICEGLNAETHLHCCHSVYKRNSDVSGDYKPILPRLQTARVDRINLEFAYSGTGDISDLELLPRHLGVGLGVVDVRREEPQTVEAMEALGAAAAAVISPARIALNPDCGFAPDCGEPPSIDEAYDKLKRLAEAARRLRSRFAPGA